MNKAENFLVNALARLIISLPDRPRSYLISKFAPNLSDAIISGDPYGGSVGYFDETFRIAYGTNQWVFTCVKVIAQNVAQVPLDVFSKTVSKGKMRTERIEGHFISELVDRPNAYMTAFDLLFLTIGYLELTGDAFWYLPRIERGSGAGKVGAIIPLRPTRVTINPGKKAGDPQVISFIYRIHDFEKLIDPRDVIHFKYPNPNDDHRGQSTLQAARDTLTEDTYSRTYNKNFFKNSAMPKGAISFAQRLEETDYPRIRRQWELTHGGVDNAHRVAILEQGATWQNIGISQRDMEFISQRKLNRDDIAAVFGVPPVLVNSYERATYNNADRQVAFFWHETLIPKLTLIKQSLTNDSWKFFGSRSVESQRIFFDFDLSKVWALKRESNDEVDAQVALITSGLRTINELREKDNLDPVDYGSTWWRQATLIPSNETMDDGAKAAVASTTATARTKPMLDNSNGLRDSLKAPSACSVVDLDEKMLAEWRSFIIRTDHFEKLFGDIIGAIFKDQLRYMLRQLRAIGRKNAETKRKPYRADIETIVFDKGKAIRFTEEATLELYRRIAKAGGDRAFKLADIAGVFDLNDPEASRHMRAKQQLLARKVNDTTWSSVTERLGAGIDAGESIQQLADGVNEIMLDRFASKHTIARTEVVGCMNGGLHDGHKQAGMTDKTWLTAGDEVVRDPHIALNGTTVGIDEKFVTFNRIGTKAELLYPGDPDGGAEQVINCRCTTVGKKKENKR